MVRSYMGVIVAKSIALVIGVGLSLLSFRLVNGAETDFRQEAFDVHYEENVRIPMRDGVTLGADVFRPQAEGKFPALMLLRYYRTGNGDAKFFAKRGYTVVLVDSRGRGKSDGEWEMYVNETKDGFDVHQWIGEQDWCNGKIGMFGRSYNGFTQLMPATLASPFLKCLVPVGCQQSNFGHLYNDGVLQLNVVFTAGLFATGKTDVGPHIPLGDHYRQLPLMSAADKVDHPQAQRVKTWIRHSSYDDYWKSYAVKDKYHQIQVPAFFVTGWYDNLVHETWRNFQGFRQQGGSKAARNGTKILVSAGQHGGYGPLREERLRWYGHWLKNIDTGLDDEAPIKIYVMGADKWREEYEWPLARTEFTPFYIHSKGNANSVAGGGTLDEKPPSSPGLPDQFVYDPADPVPTLGGQISTHKELWGPKDRSSVQQRQDILVYTSAPLASDMEVTGPVTMKLFAASTAVDTDFTATLTDVHPDGTAIHICEGILGVTFRESLERPTPIQPGEIYEYTIDMWETSMLFKKGHCIRLEISSSNFPRYARNQNTGLPLGTSAEIKVAQQTIYHDSVHPSQLILPVIPPHSSRD